MCLERWQIGNRHEERTTATLYITILGQSCTGKADHQLGLRNNVSFVIYHSKNMLTAMRVRLPISRSVIVKMVQTYEPYFSS